MENEEHRAAGHADRKDEARAELAIVSFGATAVSALLLLTGVHGLILTLLKSFAVTREAADRRQSTLGARDRTDLCRAQRVGAQQP